LWPEHLSGGFIGVDVFFVISGYLITAHLFREHERSGKIALGSFWARRAKRLLPAALLVLVVSAVLAYVFIPAPRNQNDFVQIGWAAMYVLNWVLSSQSLDYFAQEDGQTLVVHYWSLSVEEQFYIFWPILLAVAFLLMRSISKKKRTRFLVATILLVVVSSFTYAVWGVATRPEAVYFETTARAWEFGAGALLALVPSMSFSWKRRLIPLVWIAWLGLGASALVLDGESGVPGPVALIPVASAALIIVVGEGQGALSPSRITSLKPVQWLGDVSYSAYLWHFPIIVIAPFILGRWITATEKLAILVLALLLAALTKRFVEDPMRFVTLARVSPRVVLSGALASMIVIGGGLAGGTTFYRAQAEAAATELLAEAQAAGAKCFGAQAILSGEECPASHVLADPAYLNASPEETLSEDDAELGGLSCVNEEHGDATVRVCIEDHTPTESVGEVALIGDSHLMVWRDAIRATAQDLDMHVRTYFKPGCPPSLNLDLQAKGGADPVECRAWKTPAIEEIANDPDIDVVVTSAWSDSYRTPDGADDDGSGYVEAWQMWLEAGKRVIVLNDTPRLRGTIADCILEDGVDSIDPCSRPRDEAVSETVLQSAAQEIVDDNFAIVDYTDVLCDEQRCHSVVGGIPAYRDSHHLSIPLTRSFGTQALRAELEAASTD
jgi:peptidoglycan/LPS O-acetylase OafA/YrhL